MTGDRSPDAPPADPHAALELAMGIGGALLAAGMSANDVVVLVLRITGAYGLPRMDVDVTYTTLSASHRPRPGHAPVTAIHLVRPDVVDYTRVRRLNRLCDDIGAGLPLERAIDAYRRICSAPRPYPRWVPTLARAALASAVCLRFAGSWRIVLLAFLTGCLLDPVLAVLDRRRVPLFFRLLAAAGLTTAIAAAVTAAADHGVRLLAGVDANLVVVGGIVVLLAGATIVGAAQDAIDQFYLTASARMFDVVMRTAGIVAGIVLALRIIGGLGIELPVSPRPVVLGPLTTQLLGAALISALFALSVYADAVTIGLCGGTGLLAWVGYAMVRRLGTGEALASASGAVLAALVATLLVRRHSVPGFGLISAAVLPLVPGLTLYNGLLRLVGTVPGQGDPVAGWWTLLLAFAVAVGIAAGASLGTYLGRPMVEQLGRIRC